MASQREHFTQMMFTHASAQPSYNKKNYKQLLGELDYMLDDTSDELQATGILCV